MVKHMVYLVCHHDSRSDMKTTKLKNLKDNKIFGSVKKNT